jgi:hypothetical protein
MLPIRAFLVVLLFTACSKPEPVTPAPTPVPTPTLPGIPPPGSGSSSYYDLEAKGIPLFATADYIELNRISKISRFRSGEGHAYNDNFESCSSMKHYYQPPFSDNWATIKIFSPVKGTISKIEDEWAGKQVHITPDSLPYFRVILFHVNIDASFKVNDKVGSGQQLGTHISSQTSSDIAIRIETTKGQKLVSWFDVMSDSVFSKYKLRGIKNRADAIITKAERDADPLNCTGEAFGTKGKIENWITLQ